MSNPTQQFTVFNFYHETRLDKGRLKHQAIHDIGALEGIMAEAINYGYDIQFIQPKGDSKLTHSPVLYFSVKGFKQR